MDTVAPPVTEKQWVLDAAGSHPAHRISFGGLSLEARQPGPGGFLVGYSTQPESTAKEARMSALHSAEEEVRALLTYHFVRNLSGRRERFLGDPNTRRFSRLVVQHHLEDLVEDRVDQEMTLPSGRFYRSAVLVKADEETLARLQRELGNHFARASHEKTRRRQQIVTTAVSALGLVIFVFFIYCFLNAGTKGHFAWPLRIVSLLALVVLLGLFFMVLG
jgi:hypothetical protein